MSKISRFRVKSVKNGKLQISGYFDHTQSVKMSRSKGFISIPDIDDEIVVAEAFGNQRHNVAIGIIESGVYNVAPGDRLVITEGAAILLRKNGSIQIIGNTKIKIETKKTVIEMSESGDLNISTTGKINATGGSLDITTTGEINLTGSEINLN